MLGKVLPKLQRRIDRSNMAVSLSTSDDDANMSSDTPEGEEVSSPTADYVFRIVFLTDR